MKDYGKALKILRKRAGLTQAQLAEKLNVTYQTVSKWENGVNAPDISVMENVCEILSCPVDEFLRLASDDAIAAAESFPRAVEEQPQNKVAPLVGDIILAPPVVQSPAPAANASTRPKSAKSYKLYIILAAVIGGLMTLATILMPVIAIAVIGGNLIGGGENNVPDTPTSEYRYCVIHYKPGEHASFGLVYDIIYKGSEQEKNYTLHDAPRSDHKGYKFAGWEYNGVIYDAGAIFIVPFNNDPDDHEKEIYITATWKPITYTLRYSWEDEYFDETLTYDEPHALSSSKFARVGYKQDCWWNGKRLSFGEKVLNLTSEENGVYVIKAIFEPISYCIRFKENEYDVDDGTLHQFVYRYDEQTYLPEAMFERTGYNHTGWECDGKFYSVGQDITNFTSIDNKLFYFTAVFEPITYSMTVDFKFTDVEFGGRRYDYVSSDIISCVYGVDPLAGKDCRHYGLEFLDWTVYDRQGNVYGGDRRYLNDSPGAYVRAKANWKSGEYYLVLRDDKSVMPNDVIAMKGDQEYVLPSSEIADETALQKAAGYRLLQWRRDNADGKYLFDVGETVSDLMVDGWYIGGSYDKPFVEMKAEWTPNEYTVKFDGNGGTGDMNDLGCTYDDISELPKNTYVRDGYVFVGWRYDGKLYEDGATVKNLTAEHEAEITFVAEWVQLYAGKGTAAEPYEIGTFAELGRLYRLVDIDKDLAAAHYKLTSDIDCGGGALYAVGSKRSPFCGTFDGDGHVIRNAVFKAAKDIYYDYYDYKGLFGNVRGGRLTGIGIENYTIDDGDCKELYAAPLAVYYISEQPLTECYAKGVITSTDGELYSTGGLVAYLSGVARNCYAECELTVAYLQGKPLIRYIEAGGFAGTMYCTDDIKVAGAQNCYADFTVNITSNVLHTNVKIGMFSGATVHNSGKTTYTDCFAVGGISLTGVGDGIYCGNAGKFTSAHSVYYPINVDVAFDNVRVCGDIVCVNASTTEFVQGDTNCGVMADPKYGVQVDETKDNLLSLDWLAANMAFDKNVWEENAGGLPALKKFVGGI